MTRTETESDVPAIPWTAEKPRFLAGSGRHGNYKRLPDGRHVYVEPPEDTDSDHGYTAAPFRGLPNEPECVGPAILDSYAEINRRILTHHLVLEAAQAQEERQQHTPQNRLDTIKTRAKFAHVDLSHEIHIVQRQIDKARMKDKPIKESALTRMTGLEALLDGVSIARLAA